MRLGGVMTSFFMVAGIVIFGIGFYLVSVKDEDSIDLIAGEVKSMRTDLESHRTEVAAQRKELVSMRDEALIVLAKIESQLKSESTKKAEPRSPTRVEVFSREAVSFRTDKPIQVEIIDRRIKPAKKKAKLK